MFTEAKDDGGPGDNWSYKSCKAPVKSSPPINQHAVFLQAGCPSGRPTNSVKALKGKSTGRGSGIRGLTRGKATLPKVTGNQELLVVRDKVGRPPGELGVSKSVECDIFHHTMQYNELMLIFAPS